MSDLIRLAGLYEVTSQAGGKYFRGGINSDAGLLLLRNRERRTERDPEWILYVSKREPAAQTAPEPVTEMPTGDQSFVGWQDPIFSKTDER